MINKIFFAVLGLSLVIISSGDGWSGNERYPIMKPDRDTLHRWIESYESASKVFIDRKLMTSRTFEGSVDLLNHLQYTPGERSQGSCGNCWLWAGTGVMEIANSVQSGIKDRLSIQYADSCQSGDYACCGGWLEDVAAFYSGTGVAISWSNTNAHFQDAGKTCSDGSSGVSCGSISTDPSYEVVSVTDLVIDTHGVGQSTAINNIKNVLNQNKGVWFGFFLSDDGDWDNFYDFWINQNETSVWNPDYSCGHTWVDGEGGGHAVLILGYVDEPGDSYWLALNSWGTTIGRPNGLFRIDMNMDYGCTFFDEIDYYSHYFQTLDIEFGQCSDSDGDGECDAIDNCLNTPNGPLFGTCAETIGTIVKGTGVTCTSGGECGSGETCQINQEDCNSNGVGDACECYADFDNDGNVYPSDLSVFLDEYGRTDCISNPPCQADIDGDGNVYPGDLSIFLEEYGREDCPTLP